MNETIKNLLERRSVRGYKESQKASPSDFFDGVMTK